ncbi:hypothetical protein [Paenibacillus xylanilyticus]|uniref:hypothetical protein n=1 Tax=Paenibacillus xylanilyticus TaxID=248903 RepID=UPI001FECE6CA|nr:hypothetical protein [Paenibacillus xylanilyticus]
MNSKTAVTLATPGIETVLAGGKAWTSYAFICGLLIYAVYSAPFPAQPGLIEGIIAALLIVFVSVPTGIVVMSGGFTIYQKYNLFPVALHIGFFTMLWLGLFNGAVVYSWNVVDIIRDLIPCVYIFAPFLLLPAMKRSKLDWFKILPWILSINGVVFAVRFYLEAGISPLDVGKMYYSDNLLYLPYDPSVSFASIFLPIMAVHTWKGTNLFRWSGSLLMLVAGLVSLGSLMAVAQRAPLGLAVLSYFIYFLIGSRKSFKKIILLLIILISVFILVQDQLASTFDLLMTKQEDYGMNGKNNEMIAVLHETSRSIYSLFFGIGWGGLFYDPTYNAEVSFTHSAITFFLLKGGIIGLLVFLYYLSWISRRILLNMTVSKLPYSLSVIVPLTIGLIFQPTFKTLSYGMVLTFLCLLFPNSHTRRQES